MTESAALTPQRDLSEWKAQNLRITLFIGKGSVPQGPDLWNQIVGEDPEKIELRPREGGATAQGLVDERALSLKLEPSRIDWNSSQVPSAEADGFAEELQDYQTAIRAFLSRMDKGWLSDFGGVKRLAFGAVLFLPATDKDTGYATLNKYLPSVDLSTDSSEFFYQINRRRPSTVAPELEINRLSKWSVAIFAKSALAINLEESDVHMSLGAQSSACRLELDINTVPKEGTDLPSDKVGDLFHELVSLAEKIVVKGDVS